MTYNDTNFHQTLAHTQKVAQMLPTFTYFNVYALPLMVICPPNPSHCMFNVIHFIVAIFLFQ